ncbi:MAG TPA: metallophosphoesterase family protein [Candidatus Polarisedimenticolaceae bacterium]|nr:metallophosphoesterase family protein [Candidatus Polarisedimenticolaceae bacterium]
MVVPRRAWQTAALLLVAAQPVRAASVTRGPYLQRGTPQSVVVRWRTDVATDSRVTWGSQPGSLTSSTTLAATTTEHVVTVAGLDAATTYYYAVGSTTQILAGDDAATFFVTAPPSGSAPPVRLWVLGDSGTGDQNAFDVRDAYAAHSPPRHTDLWLMLGDNAYPVGSDADYQQRLFDVYPTMLRQSVLWPTLGNHDGFSSDSATQSGPYYDAFSLPSAGEAGGLASGTEAYYSFDFANVHFVVLDSFDSDRSAGGAMVGWLAADLAATQQDWIVAYWHHPPYSKGSHDSDSEQELIEMRQNVVPVLDAYGVDLTLSGHSHSYERSFLIDGHYGDSASFSPAMQLDAGDGREGGDGAYHKPELGAHAHAGTVHAVCGSSGQISGGPLDHPAMVVSLNVLGSLVLDVAGNRLDASFLDAAGVVRDEFTLIKGCPEYGPFGSASPLLTPGLCDAGPPCGSDLGSSISSSFAGAFWQLGAGDPPSGSGVDNGTFPALDGASAGWVVYDAGQPASLRGSWAQDARVDGCIGSGPEPRCMALLVGDQAAGVGYFAALTAAATPEGAYEFGPANHAPIRLAAVPKPAITGSSAINSYTLQIHTLVAAIPPEGLYLDSPACSSSVVTGYRIYEQRTARGAAPPLDRRRDDWEPAAGGSGPGGAPLPLGTPTVITLTCYTAVDVFLATSLVFDGGFETPLLSRNSTRILCSSCAVDGDQDGACGQFLGGGAGPDCDDADAQVWATPGEARSVAFAPDRQTLSWAAPLAPGCTAGSLAYDTLRASAPAAFGAGAACVESDDGPNSSAVDPAVPPPGAVRYYLVRAENPCGTGPLGTSSSGLPRSGRTCP